MIDPMLNSVDETFGIKLAEVIKEYVTELVDHQTDIITDSDWFYEKVEKMVDERVAEKLKRRGKETCMKKKQ
tara:strand:+ start:114 stop:329 length:216 start_codon:yes stop_codon:yes gene_type:complete